MREVEDIIEKVALVKDGFKSIRDLAGECLARQSGDETLVLAHDLYQSEVHQTVMTRLGYPTVTSGAFVNERREWRQDPAA